MRRIDENGQYCEYQGLTVIANTVEQDKALWQQVHHSLGSSSLINKYFSALPLESYHLTTMNLFTEDHDGQHDWHDFILDRLELFRDLHAELETDPLELSVRVQSGIHLKYFPSVLQLSVDLTPEARARIDEIAKKFNCSQKVPSSFHITLAYQYQYIPPNDAQLVKEYVEKELNDIFKLYGKSIIELQKPTLCSFTDMTSFTSWDGERYPFSTYQSYHGR